MNISDYYTPFDELISTAQARWEDRALRTRLEEFLGSDMPRALREGVGPAAVSVRCIATPDNEFLNFLGQANTLQLRPVFLEYAKDKFVAKNEDKYALCKLHFFSESAANIKECPTLKLIDFNRFEGKAFADIRTLSDETLVDFHHGLLHEYLGEETTRGIAIEDFSDWFNRTRYATEHYYFYYLSLFVCHGVLFENLLMSDDEREFTETKILPSFKRIEEEFGVKPLIHPITPTENEDDFRWWTYPGDVKLIAEKRLSAEFS